MKVSIALVCLSLVYLAQMLRANDLPAGIPRVVDTNGNTVFIDPMFTTEAFGEEGLRLVIEEANKVATQLKLPEPLPITRSNLAHAFISPFGYTYLRRRLGNITTANYSYNIGEEFKFSDLTVANYDSRCREYYEKYQWPIARLDTNSPYQLATQWLAAVNIDVAGLNRDCDTHVAVDPYWNDVEFGAVPKGKFTPMYFVWWTPRNGKSKTGAAQVEIFLPAKTLLQLNVYDPKYILRKPLAFTNLAVLFPGKAEITTNKPGPVIEIHAPR